MADDRTMRLTVTAVGDNQPEVIPDLTQLIAEAHCNIIESRLTVSAGQFAAHWFVEGNWNHIAKLENSLAVVASRYTIKVAVHRLDNSEEQRLDGDEPLPYRIELVGIDRPGIIYEVVDFLQQRGILIQEMASSSYAAPYTGAAMLVAQVIIGVPNDLRLLLLREEFLDYCDQNNFDAVLEPIKR